MKSNVVKGFTLIEMIMVLAIAAILITVAVPSFSTFTKNSRITAQVNKMVSAINLARGEASKRGTRVALCRTANPTAATPSCGGAKKDWSTGWIVYAVGDSRADPLFDTSKGDELIGAGQLETGVDVFSNSINDDNLEFNADGTTNQSGGTARFAICDDRGKDYGRLIEIKPVGRPDTSDSTSCLPAG